MGGLTSVAVVARAPEGLQGGINFAGGTGGNPKDRPGQPCGAVQIERHWQSIAAQAKAPMLWLYWPNDLYWGADHPRQWHAAYVRGGGQAEWVSLAPIPGDGHQGFSRDMDHWTPAVDQFLAPWGFTRDALPPLPDAALAVPVDDVTHLPQASASRRDLYQRFLASPKPRAFAIGPSGQSGYATGDWAVGRALGFCQSRSGVTCRVYAVDDRVVWAP